MNQRPTVCVIGCGPGGMFFLHNLEKRRRELLEQGDEAALANFPDVTVFDRASGPGGVWLAKRSHDADDHWKDGNTVEEKKSVEVTETETANEQASTNMYEALWTNGPKEQIEFFDYSFQEHFGHALPVYMPRAAVLDYLLTRVKKENPKIFDEVEFNTSVDICKYNHDKQRFEVTVTNQFTGITSIREFDKCIWAGGENGKQEIPKGLFNMFKEGGFQGRMIHSSDTSNFEADVKGKRILIVGGGYSAEDLALVAVKTGVEHVYISNRSEENVVSWTRHWPGDKVTVLGESTPVGVTNGGRCIQIGCLEQTEPDKYKPTGELADELLDIDTIIFCTGYKSNNYMLDDELKAPYLKLDEQVPIPEGWKMKENGLTKLVGDVPPGEVLYNKTYTWCRDIYKGVSVLNPNMMFLFGDLTDAPLLGIDVYSTHLVNLLTGKTEVPSPEEMRRRNDEQALYEITNFARLRHRADKNYFRAVEDKWVVCDEYTKIWYEMWDEESEFNVLFIGDWMKVAKYPLQLGNFKDGLTEKGKEFLRITNNTAGHRWFEPKDEAEKNWKTFRDIKNAHEFKSIWTGTAAVPLKKRWLDIDDAHDKDILKLVD